MAALNWRTSMQIGWKNRKGAEMIGKEIRARYNKTMVLFGLAFTSVMMSILLFSPPLRVGRMAGVLKTETGLTIFGWIMLTIVMYFFVLYLFYLIRMVVGLPSLKWNGEDLHLGLAPTRTIPANQIKKVTLQGAKLTVHTMAGGQTTRYVALVENPEDFIEALKKVAAGARETERIEIL